MRIYILMLGYLKKNAEKLILIGKFARAVGYFCLVGLLLLTNSVRADESKERIAAMERVGENLKVIAPVAKDLSKFEGEDVEKIGQDIFEDLKKASALFNDPETAGKDRAKASIWEDKDAFDALFLESIGYAEAVVTSGADYDADAFADAFKGLAGSCRECHQDFRGPKK